MKPDTSTAMAELIEQIRANIPFGLTEAQLCQGTCSGCSKKLLDYLDQTLDEHSQSLANSEIPTLGDVRKLGKLAVKIHNVLQKNGLV
ncbi:hypothetical protein [Parendozoicomonas sp. Alg238-R29]|uniref:hypothetical protein n=1 Tax=Parendozoicomonas sp. Alg238-R29 TaxID=2993446 RepID=UPI00248EADCF|nr:hypothetical protein [Parendozoicomonas sp. Alg238-R29]